MTRRQFIAAVTGALAGVAMIRPWRWRAVVAYKGGRPLRAPGPGGSPLELFSEADGARSWRVCTSHADDDPLAVPGLPQIGDLHPGSPDIQAVRRTVTQRLSAKCWKVDVEYRVGVVEPSELVPY